MSDDCKRILKNQQDNTNKRKKLRKEKNLSSSDNEIITSNPTTQPSQDYYNIKSIIDIAREEEEKVLHPKATYYKNNFPLFLRDEIEDGVCCCWTDIPDFLIWKGLKNVSYGLSKEFSPFQDVISGFYSAHIAALQGSADTFIGPIGIVTLLEHPLDFSQFLSLNIRKSHTTNALLVNIWDNQISYIKKKIIDTYKHYKIYNEKMVKRLNQAIEARREIFFLSNLSLYERMLIYANAWLVLHVFVYYVTFIKDDSDSNGYSLKNLLVLNKAWWWFMIDNDIKKFNIDANVIRKRINAIEKISIEILSPEYELFHFSSQDKRLRLHRAIQADLTLCASGMFENLNTVLKERREFLGGRVTQTRNQMATVKNFSSKIEREIRIIDAVSNCRSDDNRNYVIIFQKGLASRRFVSKILQLEEENTSDKELKILNEMTDFNLDCALEDLFDLGNDDIFLEDKTYDTDELDSEEENDLNHIAKKRGTTAFQLRNKGYQYIMPLLHKVFLMEDLGPMTIIPFTDTDNDSHQRIIINIAQSASESLKECMALEELSRSVKMTNRGLVEFVGSRYDIEQNPLLKYNPHSPFKVCRLTELPAESQMGVHSINIDGQSIPPSPIDFMTCVMVHLAFGNINMHLDRDFVTLPKKSTYGGVEKRKKRSYARIMLIPPTSVTEIDPQNMNLRKVELALRGFINKFISNKFSWIFEDFVIIFNQLCQPKTTGISPILRSIMTVNNNLNKYNLSKPNILQIIKNNYLISASYLRSVVTTIFRLQRF